MTYLHETEADAPVPDHIEKAYLEYREALAEFKRQEAQKQPINDDRRQ